MGFLEDWFDEDEREEAADFMRKARKKLHDSGYTFARFKKEYFEHFPESKLNEDDLVEQFDNCAIDMALTKGVESFSDWIENLKHPQLLTNRHRQPQNRHSIWRKLQ